MRYTVQTVADHELPAGIERVIVEREDESVLILLSGSTARCWNFMRAYENSVEPSMLPSILFPERRALLHAV